MRSIQCIRNDHDGCIGCDCTCGHPSMKPERVQPHLFESYLEASEICRHCDRGQFAGIHNLDLEDTRPADWTEGIQQ